MMLVTGHELAAAEAFWIAAPGQSNREAMLLEIARARETYDRSVAVTVDGETVALADAQRLLQLRHNDVAFLTLTSQPELTAALAAGRRARLAGIIADGMTVKFEVEIDPAALAWDAA